MGEDNILAAGEPLLTFVKTRLAAHPDGAAAKGDAETVPSRFTGANQDPSPWRVEAVIASRVANMTQSDAGKLYGRGMNSSGKNADAISQSEAASLFNVSIA